MFTDKKTLLWHTLAASVVAASFFLLLFFLYDVENFLYPRLGNAFFISGAVILGVALLVLIAKDGTFDFLSYGVAAFARGIRPTRYENKFDDFESYREYKRGRRSWSFLYVVPYLAIGIVFVVLGVVFSLAL